MQFAGSIITATDRQPITHQFSAVDHSGIQFGICHAAGLGEERPKAVIFRTDHKLFISIHVAFLYDERKKSILIQHAYTVLLGRIQIFFFCVLYSTADKQRRLGGKDDIKNLQMILLDHSFTPIKSGMEYRYAGCGKPMPTSYSAPW